MFATVNMFFKKDNYKYHAIINGLGEHGKIRANTIQELKKEASKIANEYRKSYDYMEVWNKKSLMPIFQMNRINQKFPNGIFIAGEWK